MNKVKPQVSQQARTPGQQQPPSLRQLFKQRDISIEKYKIQLPDKHTEKNRQQMQRNDFKVDGTNAKNSSQHGGHIGASASDDFNDAAVGQQLFKQGEKLGQLAGGSKLEEGPNPFMQGPLTTPSQLAQNNKIASQYQNLTSDE